MIDQVEFEVAGGRGGNGAVSFRHERFAPLGGPDGGDGGRGGDVVLVAERRYSGLDTFSDARLREARPGGAGGQNQRRGASAPDLELAVPVGTTVWDAGAASGEPLADLSVEDMRVVVACGGRGGWGNRRFTTATRQAPKWAQAGADGDHRRLRLEVRLLADVGLVGLPNAGKSTLLSVWSRATPKIAAYPFTTLEPQLGVVSVGYDSFVVADLPGLIEGASAGLGLGHEFLRHIERTRVVVHLLDMTREEPLEDYALVNEELRTFGHGLADKPQILGLNKVDDPDARARIELLEPQLAVLGVPWLPVSAATREGTRELAIQALRLLRDAQALDRAEPLPLPVLRPEPARRSRFEAWRDAEGVVNIDGATPNWLARTLDLGEREPRQEFFARLRRMGVNRALGRLKVQQGERVHIGGVEVAWEA